MAKRPAKKPVRKTVKTGQIKKEVEKIIGKKNEKLLEGYAVKAMNFLKFPEKSFRNEQKSRTEDGLRYFMTLAVVFAVLGGIVNAVMAMNALTFITSAIVSYIMLVVGTFIAGIIMHVCASFLGAKKTMRETLKVVFYASTPSLLLAWIPVIGILAWIWSIVLAIIGLKVIQNMVQEKAILAVLIPVIIIVGIMAFGAAAFLMGGGMPMGLVAG